MAKQNTNLEVLSHLIQKVSGVEEGKSPEETIKAAIKAMKKEGNKSGQILEKKLKKAGLVEDYDSIDMLKNNTMAMQDGSTTMTHDGSASPGLEVYGKKPGGKFNMLDPQGHTPWEYDLEFLSNLPAFYREFVNEICAETPKNVFGSAETYMGQPNPENPSDPVPVEDDFDYSEFDSEMKKYVDNLSDDELLDLYAMDDEELGEFLMGADEVESEELSEEALEEDVFKPKIITQAALRKSRIMFNRIKKTKKAAIKRAMNRMPDAKRIAARARTQLKAKLRKQFSGGKDWSKLSAPERNRITKLFAKKMTTANINRQKKHVRQVAVARMRE